jgi:WhiB family transcriptional regulator, redox-sensing transcriptional regulator
MNTPDPAGGLPTLAEDIETLRRSTGPHHVLVDTPCTDHPDPHLWFPERGVTPTAAIHVCVTCPHRVPCLAFGVGATRYPGVWGGRSRNERRHIARALRT